MEVNAITKNIRMSPSKVREVLRQIQGLNALEAKAILDVIPRKSAFWALKTLNSALANAENNHQLDVENLVIKEAVTGAGPTLKRWRPKARGSAGRILKRTCRIRITLKETEA